MIENPIRVITIYPNFSNKGGAQNIALRLAEKLNEINTPIVPTGIGPSIRTACASH